MVLFSAVRVENEEGFGPHVTNCPAIGHGFSEQKPRPMFHAPMFVDDHRFAFPTEDHLRSWFDGDERVALDYFGYHVRHVTLRPDSIEFLLTDDHQMVYSPDDVIFSHTEPIPLF